MNKFLVCMLSFGILFWTTPSYADPEVITLEQGEKAPWAGTLLNPEAAAKILATGDSELAKCMVEAERNLASRETELQFEISTKEAEFVACTMRQTQNELIYKQHVEYLERRSANRLG